MTASPIIRRWVGGALAAIVAIAFVGYGARLIGVGASEPPTKGGPPEIRRLTQDQYRQIIADVFGNDIKVAGRFEQIVRQNGFVEVGAAAATVSPTGFEQFDVLARAIAAQVLDDKHRSSSVPCRPASINAPDDACAARFLGDVGRRLFRRPLTSDELKARINIADTLTTKSGNFYSGLEFALAGMLEMPEFLFRIDTTEPDPAHPGAERLDGFSKASRLSFLIWNTAPDEELLEAAQRGDLNTETGLTRQADRMLSSPRLVNGVRAFFSDMLAFNAFESLEKDGMIYPAFSHQVADSAKEQTLLTIVNHLITENRDYRDLFTTRETFINRALGPIYWVPVQRKDGWEAFEFPADDQRQGLLTQVSFTALYAHPGRSSATLRGKAIRELLLCEKVPSPPANVNFTIVQDTSNPDYKTARARLTAHSTAPACAGCHKIMDPIGLALENFDGAGQFRSQENGAPIDPSGELDGVRFNDAAGLGAAMHDNPATTACLVSSLYRYAVGRDVSPQERDWLQWLDKSFAADRYRLPELFRQIATSKAFYAVSSHPDTTAAKDERVKRVSPLGEKS